MLNISSFIFNAFGENTYILHNKKKQCWIIDPGMYDTEELQLFNEHIDKNGLIPQAIINTHAHLDHIFGVQSLKDRYNIPFGIHHLEASVLSAAPGAAMLFGFDDLKKAPEADFFISEQSPLILGDDKITVLFTPGHSPGSIVFYYPGGGWAIGGDVLFSGSIGRTDLPGGSYETLINSIKTRLFTLPDDTAIYPGHGPATTIYHEKQYNQFLK